MSEWGYVLPRHPRPPSLTSTPPAVYLIISYPFRHGKSPPLEGSPLAHTAFIVVASPVVCETGRDSRSMCLRSRQNIISPFPALAEQVDGHLTRSPPPSPHWRARIGSYPRFSSPHDRGQDVGWLTERSGLWVEVGGRGHDVRSCGHGDGHRRPRTSFSPHSFPRIQFNPLNLLPHSLALYMLTYR